MSEKTLFFQLSGTEPVLSHLLTPEQRENLFMVGVKSGQLYFNFLFPAETPAWIITKLRSDLKNATGIMKIEEAIYQPDRTIDGPKRVELIAFFPLEQFLENGNDADNNRNADQ